MELLKNVINDALYFVVLSVQVFFACLLRKMYRERSGIKKTLLDAMLARRQQASLQVIRNEQAMPVFS